MTKKEDPMPGSKRAKTAYWIFTILFCLMMPSLGRGRARGVVLVSRLPRPGRPVLPQLPHDCAFL